MTLCLSIYLSSIFYHFIAESTLNFKKQFGTIATRFIMRGYL